MSEKSRLEAIWKLHPTVFRNPVGMGYTGGKEFRAKKDGVIPVKKGDLVVVNPGRVKYGLSVGSGDMIGWTDGIFTSIEDKSAKDKIGLDQIIWYLNVKLAGGLSYVYREGIKLTDKEVLNLPRRPDKNRQQKEKIIERLWRRLDG